MKNHTVMEQAQLKRIQQLNRENNIDIFSEEIKTSKREFRKFNLNNFTVCNEGGRFKKLNFHSVKSESDHSYSSTCTFNNDNQISKETMLKNVKIDLKNKISEKNRQKNMKYTL